MEKKTIIRSGTCPTFVLTRNRWAETPSLGCKGTKLNLCCETQSSNLGGILKILCLSIYEDITGWKVFLNREPNSVIKHLQIATAKPDIHIYPPAKHDPFTVIIFDTISSTKLTKYRLRENMKGIHFKAPLNHCRTKIVFFLRAATLCNEFIRISESKYFLVRWKVSLNILKGDQKPCCY